MIKTVVTDDQGRYLVPELPVVNYKVWVRGYGIEDSKPIDTKPSANQVALKVTSAKTPQEAAKVYPGDYWLSLLAPPDKNLFPGTGEKSDTNPNGNGVNAAMLTQDMWINRLKSGCNFCHQLGNTLTRDVHARVGRQARSAQRPISPHGSGVWESEFAEPTCTPR